MITFVLWGGGDPPTVYGHFNTPPPQQSIGALAHTHRPPPPPDRIRKMF